MTFDYAIREQKTERKACPRQREHRRLLGFFFVTLASMALLHDMYLLMSGASLAHLAGFSDIWLTLDEIGYKQTLANAYNFVSPAVWDGLLQPLLNAPIVLLFGLPGLVLMRLNCREIKARPPTLYEIEMTRLGLKPGRRVR